MRSPSKTICFCRIWGDFIIVIHGVTFESQSPQTRMITDFFLVLSVLNEQHFFKNKCRLLVGNTFSPKFRQGYIFSHNQTNIPIEHLNILVALTVYNGTLTDLNMVNQFVNDGPV